MSNIISLHNDLKNKTYTHSNYQAFKIADPKPRNIHKAEVKDRLLHHAIYRILYPYFDKTFISDSYSCRKNKGTHKAFDKFRDYAYKVSNNHTRTCWVLKCDIRRFFDSIDHGITLNILKESIADKDIVWLLERVITSFNSGIEGKGLPLGNLTSQLLVNIYMNKFDQYVKHILKVKKYIRYADDFVFMSTDKEYLENILVDVEEFLNTELKLDLHPKKVSLTTFSSGIDFLGWLHFTDHRVLRAVSKRRMLNRVSDTSCNETIQSCLGLLKHGNTYELQEKVIDLYVKHMLNLS